MAIASRIRQYLQDHKVPFQVVQHPYAETSLDCAHQAHIPPQRMAKGVVLKDDEGFMMAVVPSDRKVDLNQLNLRFNRLLSPAGQTDVNLLFGDCRKGAVPALGQAYNLRMVWDDEILQEPDCYIEAGSHEELLYLSRATFINLMKEYDHGHISH